jgi:multidrug resistance efflux pump
MTTQSSNLEWQQPASRVAHWTFWILALFVVAGIIWSAITQIQLYGLVLGQLEPERKLSTVEMPFAGRVLDIKAQLWREVKKGDVLFVVDGVGTDASESKLKLERSKNQLEDAQKTLENASLDAAQQLRKLEAVKAVYEVGAASRLEYKEAKENATRAKTVLAQAQLRLRGLKLEQAQQQRLLRLVVRAPISGTVANLAVEQTGKLVGAGNPLVDILPRGAKLVLRGYLSESDRPKVRENAKAEVAWNAYPRQKYGITSGVVKAIAPTSTGRYALEIRFAALKLEGPLGNRPLLPGMTAEARVIAATKPALGLFWDWLRGVSPLD